MTILANIWDSPFPLIGVLSPVLLFSNCIAEFLLERELCLFTEILQQAIKTKIRWLPDWQERYQWRIRERGWYRSTVMCFGLMTCSVFFLWGRSSVEEIRKNDRKGHMTVGLDGIWHWLAVERWREPQLRTMQIRNISGISNKQF